MSNLAANLTATASGGPERVALELDGTEVRYGDLDVAAARVAGLLAERGVRPGDRVGLMLPNVPQFATAYYGTLRAGAIAVPMNTLLKQREAAYCLTDSEARIVFAWHNCADVARPASAQTGAECIVVAAGEFEELLASAPSQSEISPREDIDTAVILYTSGTTGTPKGAELTHANLARNAEIVVRMLAVGPDDVILGALPLFHAFGQTCGLNAATAAGAKLALIPRFDPAEALEVVERSRVTVFEGVPTMFAALLHCGRRADTSSLRLCVSGGAAMPIEVMRGFEDAFGCRVLEGYGLSETSPVASFNQPDRARKPGSIGMPVEGVQMRLVDTQGADVAPGEVGEITIRGHNVMKGYWNCPEATTEAIRDGWFYTGDLARTDRDGYYFIVDRKKDMIIRGGYNVYPREIEEVLYEHPAVLEVAVIGIPDERLGEEIGAAVALKDGAEATRGELREYVKARVAAYKYPRHIWLLPELPKGATGKILKREIELPATLAAPTG